MRLSGKVALVTGAASGIGRATARRFLAEGARVAAVDLDEASIQKGVDGEVLAIAADVSDETDVTSAVARIKAKYGKIDALAHFAGVTRDAMASKMDLDAWDLVLRVNLTGTFLVARTVANAMRDEGNGGSIILTSSRSYLGNIGQANYAASKGGVVSLMRTMALEYGKFGIRVNALAPGFIETPMTSVVPDKLRNLAIEGTPLRRAGTAEEVAAVTLFLASEDSSYITGIVLAVDGGRTTGLAPA
ncbi:MAG: SDR family oxidoreductase [Vulcanimicrobiaceae bacterium]